MSVNILLISHRHIGDELLATVTDIIGQALPCRVVTLAIFNSDDCDSLKRQAITLSKDLDDGDGVLIMTDMFGATPSNIALHTSRLSRAKVVAGLNLPMLLRAINYAHLSLPELYAKAIKGAIAGVVNVEPEQY